MKRPISLLALAFLLATGLSSCITSVAPSHSYVDVTIPAVPHERVVELYDAGEQPAKAHTITGKIEVYDDNQNLARLRQQASQLGQQLGADGILLAELEVRQVEVDPDALLDVIVTIASGEEDYDDDLEIREYFVLSGQTFAYTDNLNQLDRFIKEERIYLLNEQGVEELMATFSYELNGKVKSKTFQDISYKRLYDEYLKAHSLDFLIYEQSAAWSQRYSAQYDRLISRTYRAGGKTTRRVKPVYEGLTDEIRYIRVFSPLNYAVEKHLYIDTRPDGQVAAVTVLQEEELLFEEEFLYTPAGKPAGSIFYVYKQGNKQPFMRREYERFPASYALYEQQKAAEEKLSADSAQDPSQ